MTIITLFADELCGI